MKKGSKISVKKIAERVEAIKLMQNNLCKIQVHKYVNMACTKYNVSKFKVSKLIDYVIKMPIRNVYNILAFGNAFMRSIPLAL